MYKVQTSSQKLIIMKRTHYSAFLRFISFILLYNAYNSMILFYSHPTLLQAEEKRARNPVPKCPSKLPEPAIGRSAG